MNTAFDTERVTFPGGDPTNALAGVLVRPRGRVRATVLFAHCFTCSKDLRSARRLAETLVRQGLAVLRFDFTGLGESAGDFADTHFTSTVDDLLAAAEWLRARGMAPSVLVGHSLGGAAVLAAAPAVPESVAVVTLGAPSEPSHLKESVLGEVDPTAVETEVAIAGRSFRVRRELFEDLDGVHLLERLPKLRRALLVMHSPIDEVVSVEHAARIYQAAMHPKSFVSLDGADHLLLRDPADVEFVAGVMASWLERYLPALELEEVAPRTDKMSVSAPPPPEGAVRVTGGPSGYENLVQSHRHSWLSDEPKAVGGGDSGPNPYELLLGALGSCISMTLRMYADRKNIPLQGVRIELRHAKVHARDCQECESRSGLVDRIEKEIDLAGPLSEEQFDRLLEIAERCPVHRTLTSETRIDLARTGRLSS